MEGVVIGIKVGPTNRGDYYKLQNQQPTVFLLSRSSRPFLFKFKFIYFS